MRLNRTTTGLMAPLVTAMIFLCVSGGKADTLSTEEAKKKLIEQCIRQMTESSADGAGKAMSFHMLQKLGPDAKSAVPALTKALDHEDSYVRIQSAYTLWKIDQQAKAIPLLSKALKDTEIKPQDRAMAASSLGEIGPPAKAALPALIEATKDQEAQIRVSAAWALWTVDQQSELAKPVLIDALNNDDLNVFSSAAWALGEIGFDEPGLIALGEAMRDDPTRNSKAPAARRALTARRALPGLANALNSNGAGIRREAISVMSLMSETISAFGSRHTGARAAIIALTKTKKDDEYPAIRAAAAELLKKIDPEVVAEAGTESGSKKNPTTDLSDAEVVAKAFITALANQNVDEAAKYIIPEERDEFKEALKEGMPPLPKDPKVQIQLKENGTRAGVSLLNAQKPASGPPFGLNMKLSNGKWWIAK